MRHRPVSRAPENLDIVPCSIENHRGCPLPEEMDLCSTTNRHANSCGPTVPAKAYHTHTTHVYSSKAVLTGDASMIPCGRRACNEISSKALYSAGTCLSLGPCGGADRACSVVPDWACYIVPQSTSSADDGIALAEKKITILVNQRDVLEKSQPKKKKTSAVGQPQRESTRNLQPATFRPLRRFTLRCKTQTHLNRRF